MNDSSRPMRLAGVDLGTLSTRTLNLQGGGLVKSTATATTISPSAGSCFWSARTTSATRGSFLTGITTESFRIVRV